MKLRFESIRAQMLSSVSGAFECFYLRYRWVILGEVRRLLWFASEQEQLEVTQEVYFKLFADECAQLKRWDPKGGLSIQGYLRRATWFVTKNVARKRFAHEGRELPLDETETKLPDLATGPTEDPLEDQQFLDVVLNRLYERLTPRQREVFDLRYVEKLDNNETATRLGVKADAIRQLDRQIIKHLRDVMDEIRAEES